MRTFGEVKTAVLSCLCSGLKISLVAAVTVNLALANPELNNVASGNVSITQTEHTTTINQSSSQAILNWNSFNIGANESTHFQQINGGVALNRIDATQGASQIYGHLSATGQIILINGAGIHFGPSAMVNVGGIIASTVNMTDANFLAGKYIFDQSTTLNGAVINEGLIHASHYGLVALIGSNVSNAGFIKAEYGNIILGSGSKFTLSLSGDQLINFSVDDATLNAASDQNGNVMKSGVSNTGNLLAHGGSIMLSAKAAQGVLDNAINMGGTAEAKSVSAHNGEIILSADQQSKVLVSGNLDVSSKDAGTTGGTIKVLGGDIHLTSSATLNANGDAGGGTIIVGGNYQGLGPDPNALNTTVDSGAVLTANATRIGNGGNIIVWSDNNTSFHGSLFAQGGLQGGDGGLAETSGHNLDIANAIVNMTATFGKTGTWLLDPSNLTICSLLCGTTNPITGYTFSAGATDSNLSVTDLQNALATSNVVVQTANTGSNSAGDIFVNVSITWNSGNSLTLTAYRNITVGTLLTITNSGTGAINLIADNSGTGVGSVSFGLLSSATSSGGVNIFYNPTTFGSPSTPASFYSGGTTPTAYQLVNSLGAQGDTATRSLATIANTPAMWGQNFALAVNLDASATSAWNAGAGFSPIGTTATVYTGKFHGLDHTINGLYINRPTNDNVGLFGVMGLNSAYYNLGITNANITGRQSVGILGGATVSTAGATYSRIYTTGNVTGLGSQVGGLVGYMSRSIASDSYSYAHVTGPTFVGGLIGYSDSILVRTFSGGNVTGNTNSGIVGGLVGQAQSPGSITDSYAFGTVTAPTAATGIGGLIGVNLTSAVTSSYSSGLISAGATGVGGLIGTNTGTISNSYWDTVTSGLSNSAGGTGLTTIQMMQLTNFLGWNIASTSTLTPNSSPWFMIPGSTRPMLTMEEFSNTTPAIITNPHQLQLMNAYLSGTYVLGANLNFATTSPADVWGSNFSSLIGGGFSPIGNGFNGVGTPFTGSFDGKNYTINNLYIYQPTTIANSIGLFGNVNLASTGFIKNVGLNNINYSGGPVVGGLIGNVLGASLGSISNVFTTGSISAALNGTTGYSGTGGLIGVIFNPTSAFTVNNTYSAVNVNAPTTFNVGGLIGYGAGTISNSYSLGAVVGAAGTGGFIGSMSTGSTSNNFWNTQTSGLSTSLGATGLTTANFQGASFASFNGNSAWSIMANAFPYLNSFYSSTPLAVSGYVPNGSATATGIATSAVQLAINGALIPNGNLVSYANGYYYGLINSSNVTTNTPILAYLPNAAANVITYTTATNGSLILPTMIANTVSVGDTPAYSFSNSILGTLKGALSSGTTGILYSVSGSTPSANLTLSNGINFATTANTSYTIDGGISATGTGSFSFAGAVTVNNGGANIRSAGSQTYTNTLTLGSAALFTSTAGGINLANITGAGFGLTITDTTTSAMTGIFSGIGSTLTKLGTGILTLSNANTYSGGTLLSAGTLNVGLGTTGTITNGPLGTGTLTLNGGTLTSNGAYTLANPYVLSASSAIGGSNNLTLTGTGTLTSGNLSVTNTGTTTLNGNLSGAGGLIQNGGTLVLTGANNSSLTGATTLTSGILRIGIATNALGSGTLALNGGSLQSALAATLANNYTVDNGGSAINGANNLTLSGIGTLSGALTNTNTANTLLSGNLSGSGSLIQNGGALTISGANNSGLTGSTTLASGLLQISSATNALGSGSLTLNGGNLQSTLAASLANNFTVGNGGIGINGANNLTLSGTGVLTGTLTNTNTALTTLSGNLSGAGNLTQNSSATLAISGANNSSYSGATTLTSGTLQIGAATNALGSSALALNGGNLQSTLTSTLANNYTVGSNGIAINGAANLALNGTGALTGSITHTNTGTTTLGGNLNGAGNLIQNGGTLTISGANNGSFSGNTTLTSGTLQVASATNALGTGVLALNGGNLQTTVAASLANNFSVGSTGAGINGSSNLSLNGTGTLTGSLTNTNSALTILNGNLSGAGSLIQNGGTLNISGANNFNLTGNTTLTSGILQIGSATNALGSGTLALNGGNLQSSIAAALANNYTVGAGGINVDGATNLSFSGTGALTGALTNTNSAITTLSGNLSGAGSLIQNSSGTLALNGSNNSSLSGSTTLTAGTLQIGAATNALGSGSLALNDGNLQSSTAAILANNYTVGVGGVNVNGATNLSLNGTGALTGTLSNTNSAVTSLSGNLSGAGNLVQNGGTLIIDGANNSNLTGSTTLTSGILQIGVASNALGTGALALNGGNLQSTVATNLANNYTVGVNGVGINGTSNLALNGTGALTSSLTNTNTGTTTLGGNLSGAGNLIQNGGVLAIKGSNNASFTGNTTLTSGTLQIGAATNALGAGALALNGGNLESSVAATLANNYTVGSSGININGLNNLNLNGTGILTGALTNANSAITTLNGNLSGAGNLIQNNGTLILAGANTAFNGSSSIANGALLQLGNNAALGNGNITVNTGGALDTGGFNLTIAAGKTLSLNGTGLANTGALINNIGTSILSSADATGINLATPATIGGSGNITINGTVSGTALTKIGTGTLNLLGANTYTGSTTINNGIVYISADSGLGAAPGTFTANAIVFGGGKLYAPVSLTLNSNRGISYSGSAAHLTPSLTGFITKTYDSSTAAIVAASNYSVSGATNGDLVTLSANSSSYDTKNVGTGKAVSVAGISIAAVTDSTQTMNVYGYQLSSSTASATIGTIVAANLDITGVSATNKVYDATTADTLSGSASLSGKFAGDIVTLGGSGVGSFADKNVGTGKIVTATGYTISGTDAANYILIQPVGLTANITAATLNVTGISGTNKVYDATTADTLSGSASLSGKFAGDTVSLGGTGLGTFVDKNIGTNKIVTATGYSISGTDASNYILVQPIGLTADISAATLNITGVSGTNKVYDATTADTLSGNASLSGKLGSDVVNLSSVGATGTFADKNVGTGKSVSASGYTISGTDASNYILVQPVGLTADISAATLNITGVSGTNKVYDATTADTLSGSASLSGKLGSDVVNLSSVGATGTFADKNVGTGKAVSATGYTISGTDASNYILVQPMGLTADISAATLNITGITGTNKVYDATTDDTLSGTASISGKFAGDTVNLGGSGIGTFTDKNVGIGKTVTATGYTISGTDASNYILVQPVGLTADISAATLNITGVSGTNKIYDATTSNALSGTASLSGTFAGDTVNLGGNGIGTFVDKNVGVGKAVTASGYTISGTDASNYILAQPVGLTADISAATLNITGVSGTNKIYDATTADTLSGTASLSGTFAGDTVNLGGTGIGTFADKNVGIGKTVAVSGYTISGTDSSNYILVQPVGLTADISAATLNITGVSGTNKIYDATTADTLSGSATLSGTLGSDAVNLSTLNATGTFADKNVGIGKTVTATGYTISGTDASNYILVQPVGLTADISAATLNITGVSGTNKIYDATTADTLSGSATLSGTLGSDVVNLSTLNATGTFADKNVGIGKTVTATGYTISGADSSNYILVQPVGLTADISTATLNITGVSGTNKVYDATTADTLSGTASIYGKFAGDTVNLGGTGTGTFVDKNVGIGKAVTASGYTISGADSSNYILVQPVGLTADISAATLNITGVSGTNKVYDATTADTLSGTASLSGTFAGDTVNLGGTGIGTFADKNVGIGKAVTASGYTISGTDSSNYILVQPVGLTADISAATLNITGVSGTNKIYDATTADALSGTASLSGTFAGDTVNLGGNGIGTFSDKNVGIGKAVTASGYTISGTDSSNYILVQPVGLTADISAATLNITGVSGTNKVYDATTTDTLSGTAALLGTFAGDTVDLNSANATGNFADKNVGTNKAVTASGYLISGSDAANYILEQPTGLTANITAATINVIGVNATNKVYDTTTTDTISGSATLSGVLGGDNIDLNSTGVSASFADKNVGINKLVTATGYTISGSDAANYILIQPVGLTADISAAYLTITGISGTNKVYDATTANILSGTATLSGTLAGDSVNLNGTAVANFADKNVGTNKIVTASGYLLSGTDAANYILEQPNNLRADITPATLTLNANTDTKTYDGTTASSTIAGYSGLQTGDSISQLAQTFLSKNVLGTNLSILTIANGYIINDGNNGNNYIVNLANATGTINPAELIVTAQAATKIYDGNTSSVGIPQVSGNLYDTIQTNAYQTYNNPEVGVDKALTAQGLAINDGNNGANYVINYVANNQGVIHPNTPTPPTPPAPPPPPVVPVVPDTNQEIAQAVMPVYNYFDSGVSSTANTYNWLYQTTTDYSVAYNNIIINNNIRTTNCKNLFCAGVKTHLDVEIKP